MVLDHGANPNCRDHGYTISGHRYPGTALDYIIASYVRSPERLSTCIEILLEAGGATKYDGPAVLDLLRGRLDSLAEQIDADPALVNRPFPELDCGKTGGRSLTVQGGTLLHVAAEYSTSRRPLCFWTVERTSMPAQQSTRPVSADTQHSFTR